MPPESKVRIAIGCDFLDYEKSMNIYFDEIQSFLNVKLTEDQYKILLHFMRKSEESKKEGFK